MTYLIPANAVASVRPLGSTAEYKRRTFFVMLGCQQTPSKQKAEAARIIKQNGFDATNVLIVTDSELDHE
jgi:hypothetical protein